MSRKSLDSSASGQGLPHYESPPLFETVFGVRFPRLQGWEVPHFGLYGSLIRQDFPKFETQAPLPSPGTHNKLPPGSFGFQLSTVPEVRCWFYGGDRLIQIQNDGFFHNWRKVTLEEKYPRYEAVIRPAFDKEWKRFGRFLKDNDVSPPDVVECEATYVNHFEKGHEWSTISDLEEVLRWWTHGDGMEYLPTPKVIRINTRFEIDQNTLDVSLTPAVRNQDEKEILQFSLTVRGKPEAPDPDGVLAWMDAARATIVRGFTDLTTDKMHKLWGRIV